MDYTSRVLSWGPDRLVGNVLSVCHRLTFLGVKPYGRHCRSLLSYLPCSTTMTSATSSKRPWTGHGRWTRWKALARWCSAFSRYGGCSSLSCDVPPRGTSAQPVVPGPCALCSLMGPCSCPHLRDTMNPPSRHPIMLSGERSSSSFTPWIA